MDEAFLQYAATLQTAGPTRLPSYDHAESAVATKKVFEIHE